MTRGCRRTNETSKRAIALTTQGERWSIPLSVRVRVSEREVSVRVSVSESIPCCETKTLLRCLKCQALCTSAHISGMCISYLAVLLISKVPYPLLMGWGVAESLKKGS